MPRSLKDFDDLLVAQWRAAVLVFHQVQDRFFHARVAHRFAARGLIARREEIFHLEHALRRGHVFAGDRAAHGRLVHADGVGDLHHRHRLQMRRAVLEKLPLPRDDLVRDIRDRLLALMNRFDQEFPAADFVADVILHFARRCRPAT